MEIITQGEEHQEEQVDDQLAQCGLDVDLAIRQILLLRLTRGPHGYTTEKIGINREKKWKINWNEWLVG